MRKRVIVSGTSSGLGRATANALLIAGYEVIGIARTMIDHVNPNYTHVCLDLADFDAAELMIYIKAENWYGMVHCAGVSQGARLGELSIEAWQISIDTNVTSALKLCQLAHRHMMDGGRILLVGSPVGIAGANKPSYAASKAALHGLTMSASKSLGVRSITVNTILPGPMITGMTEDWSPERRAQIASGTRLQRLADPEEIAGMIRAMLDQEWSYMSAALVDLTCGSLYGH